MSDRLYLEALDLGAAGKTNRALGMASRREL
jgi:hypothetical protein